MFSSAPSANLTGEPVDTAHLDKQKSLATSAYMLIRYYKTRGHELAELDPLSMIINYAGLVNFKEFGKVYVKNSLENDLEQLKILSKRDLDEPFVFPNHPVFQEKIAVKTILFSNF